MLEAEKCHTGVRQEHHFTLTTKVYLSQHCTSAIPSHTPSLAVPLVYRRAFSSSSLIPVLSGSRGGTVWEQTGAAYNKTPCGGQTSRAQFGFEVLTELRYMCRKAWVRVRRFKSLVYQLPVSVRPWKSLWAELK